MTPKLLRLSLPIAAWALLLPGCSGMQLGGSKKKVILEDFAEGRVVQVAIADRLTGAAEMLFVSMPKKSFFLEGYVQGIVTDYEDNPIQGVIVRAEAKGEKKFVEEGQAAFQSSAFDAGVSDSNGIYRIRFSLPIIKNRVDIQGRLIYNPSFEQDCERLGRCWEPQAKESPFRMFFDMKRGMLVFSEGVRKVVVRDRRGKGTGRAVPGSAAAKPAEEKPAEKTKGADDLFGDIGLQAPQ